MTREIDDTREHGNDRAYIYGDARPKAVIARNFVRRREITAQLGEEKRLRALEATKVYVGCDHCGLRFKMQPGEKFLCAVCKNLGYTIDEPTSNRGAADGSLPPAGGGEKVGATSKWWMRSIDPGHAWDASGSICGIPRQGPAKTAPIPREECDADPDKLSCAKCAEIVRAEMIHAAYTAMGTAASKLMIGASGGAIAAKHRQPEPEIRVGSRWRFKLTGNVFTVTGRVSGTKHDWTITKGRGPDGWASEMELLGPGWEPLRPGWEPLPDHDETQR